MNLRAMFFSAVTLIAFTASAQEIAEVTSHNPMPVLQTQQSSDYLDARYPDGQGGLTAYFAEHLEYSGKAMRNGLEGTVRVKFCVQADGQLTDFRVLDSPHRELSSSALSTLQNMPRWTPAKRKGQAMASFVVLPIEYRLR
jgi:protein TonB